MACMDRFTDYMERNDGCCKGDSCTICQSEDDRQQVVCTQQPYSLLNSGCLQELQSSQFVVVVIPFSVIIITNLVDGFNLDEWLFAHRSERVYLKVLF